MHFMLDHRIEHPPGYAEQGCLLVSYRLPLLRHCFILCHERGASPLDAAGSARLLAFTFEQAQVLAAGRLGDPEAFMLIQSGHSIRKRGNWHAHIFVLNRRWQKAWIYLVLGAKNLALVLASPFLVERAQLKRPRGSLS